MDHFFSPCFSISESQSKDSVNLIKIQHDCTHIFDGCMNYSFSYCSTLMLRQIWHVIIYFCIFWWNVCIIKTKKHVHPSPITYFRMLSAQNSRRTFYSPTQTTKDQTFFWNWSSSVFALTNTVSEMDLFILLRGRLFFFRINGLY